MIHPAKDPGEYLDVLEDDWRKELLIKIRALIMAAAPDIQEGMEYKMLSYGNGQGNLFHLNAQKQHVGLYVGDIKKIDPTGSLTAGIDKGKGCLRMRKSFSIENSDIENFIKEAIRMWKADHDLSC